MNPTQITMLCAALMCMAVGGYQAFVADEPMGAVFLGVGATFAALSATVGALKKKNQEVEEQDDAG